MRKRVGRINKRKVKTDNVRFTSTQMSYALIKKFLYLLSVEKINRCICDFCTVEATYE